MSLVVTLIRYELFPTEMQQDYKPSEILDIDLSSFFSKVDILTERVAQTPGLKIVTLCGSVRFKKLYDFLNFKLSLKNVCVFSLASFGDNILGGSISSEEKVLLDILHKNKIINSQAIVVINPGGYVGDSTQSEIAYAQNKGIEVFYLEN